MSKKSLAILLILSVVVTYGTAFVDAITNTSANQAGLPFKFGSYVLFGEASTNYPLLVLDIAFWFVVIWVIWKVLQKLRKNS
ncbi:hypothetical protein KKE03_02885 [Patescibacteria group bacterium]|nr:hypothetical protein [Patescibacteria group bacterium]